MNELKGQSKADSVPVPDPTTLTTAALRAAIDNVKELLQQDITNQKEYFEVRIAAVNTLKEEKFKELHDRLTLIESRRLELKQDNQQALQAALKAQETLFRQQNQCNEEAAAKAEASFLKQLEAISRESQLGREGLSERVDALKERIDRGSGEKTGSGETRREARDNTSLFVAVGVGIISLVSLVLATYASFKPHEPVLQPTLQLAPAQPPR